MIIMNKLLTTLILILFFTGSEVFAQVEYKIVTTIESIVPLGAGRSRMISSDDPRDFSEFTSERTEDNKKRNKSKRGDIRVENFNETKLLNFFNIAGIRFENIAANDALISSKINSMVEQGWELAFVVSATESDAGKDDGKGIFVTRFIFKRNKPENQSE